MQWKALNRTDDLLKPVEKFSYMKSVHYSVICLDGKRYQLAVAIIEKFSKHNPRDRLTFVGWRV